MKPPTVSVSVRMERRALANNRWFSHQWLVQGIDLADAVHEARAEVRVFTGFDVSLYPDEAEGYFLNSSSGEPKAFVMWRIDEAEDEGAAIPKTVTLSYNEAARLMDAQEKVDAVSLPPALCVWLADYVAANYKPEPKKKRIKASFVAPRDKEGL